MSVSNRLEGHALASAEWLKMVAAFYNEEAAANEEFDSIRTRYEEVVGTVDGRIDDRKVGYVCIVAERGCEFMHAHGDDTLMGRLLAQLGVSNVFAQDNPVPNGRPFDFEEDVGVAADADVFVVYAKTYLDVDVLIRDFALGLAPELFPGAKGTCSVRAT